MPPKSSNLIEYAACEPYLDTLMQDGRSLNEIALALGYSSNALADMRRSGECRPAILYALKGMIAEAAGELKPFEAPESFALSLNELAELLIGLRELHRLRPEITSVAHLIRKTAAELARVAIAEVEGI